VKAAQDQVMLAPEGRLEAESTRPSLAHVNVCGVRIANLTKAEATAHMRGLIREPASRARAIYIVNAHTINLACELPGFRDLLNAGDAVFGDGTGVRWAARLQGIRMRDNLVGTDLVPHFFGATAAEGFRYYLLGGNDTVVHAATDHVTRTYGVTMAGCHQGHFPPTENGRVVEHINASGADVLLVAMGNPVQERWIHENREALRVRLCVGVGGLVDHWGGALRRAPKWVRARGLEWVQIMVQQPHKWRRYILGNPKFLYRCVRDSRARRRRPEQAVE
jgi:N-acetylglucosaminyldiphosphoundecaprenol N-acetyl-beta-D-mannosaminyltransferase